MNAAERQDAIFQILCRERYATLEHLAIKFEVSRITIQRDITALSCTYPIKTVRGRYGGGVYLEGWYHPNRGSLTNQQRALLHKLLPTLSGTDQQIMQSILTQFGSGGRLWPEP